jgi:large subunit ribosomal protein L10
VARPDKVAKVDEVSKDLAGAAATLLTHYRGLSVTELAELRAKLRDANADMRVVKNTLTRRAASKAGIDGLDELLVGPTGLVFCHQDPVGPAKALKEFGKDHPELVIRGGYLDGEVLDEVAATKLADLESREELLAKLAGLMQGALSGFARLLQAPIAQQARLMQALVDAGGAEAKGFASSAPAAADTADEVSVAEEPVAEEPVAEEAAPPADAATEAAADDADAPDAPVDEPAAVDAEADEPQA